MSTKEQNTLKWGGWLGGGDRKKIYDATLYLVCQFERANNFDLHANWEIAALNLLPISGIVELVTLTVTWSCRPQSSPRQGRWMMRTGMQYLQMCTFNCVVAIPVVQ